LFKFFIRYKAVCACLALFTLSCSGGDKEADVKSFATEETEANVFINDYFGVRVKKPDAWHAATPEQLDLLVGVGKDVVAGGNDDMMTALDASTKRTFPLFMFFMHEIGAPVPLNPSIVGMAENMNFMPGVKNGEDYFYHAKKLMAQSNLHYEFADEYRQRTIGGVTFDVLDLTMSFNGASVKQTYYAARHGDYVVSFIESYGADEFKDTTSKIIDSIELDW